MRAAVRLRAGRGGAGRVRERRRGAGLGAAEPPDGHAPQRLAQHVRLFVPPHALRRRERPARHVEAGLPLVCERAVPVERVEARGGCARDEARGQRRAQARALGDGVGVDAQACCAAARPERRRAADRRVGAGRPGVKGDPRLGCGRGAGKLEHRGLHARRPRGEAHTPLGHDREVAAAAAAARPEEVGMRAGRRGDDRLARRRHRAQAEDAVAAEAPRAHPDALPAAEQEARDADGRAGAGRKGAPHRGGRRPERAESRPRLHGRRRSGGVDAHAAHARGVDHHDAILNGVAAERVAAAARDRAHAPGARAAHRGDDARLAVDARDSGGAAAVEANVVGREQRGAGVAGAAWDEERGERRGGEAGLEAGVRKGGGRLCRRRRALEQRAVGRGGRGDREERAQERAAPARLHRACARSRLAGTGPKYRRSDQGARIYRGAEDASIRIGRERGRAAVSGGEGGAAG